MLGADGAAICTKVKLARSSSGCELEQPLDRREALQDALGVVEAVDADAERRVGRQAEHRADLGAALGDRRWRCSAAGGHSIEIG